MKLVALSATDIRVRTVCQDLSPLELRKKSTQAMIDSLLAFVFARNNKGASHNRRKPTIIGLSANQVGILKRICVVDLAVRRKNQSEVHVMINPHILWKSKTTTLRKEGCVNFPNIWGLVPRRQKIDVSFFDRFGNSYTMRAIGWAAILIQHEVDHLNGTLFIDRLLDPTKAHLVRAEDLEEYKKDPKNWDRFIDVTKLRRSLS